MNKEGVWIGRFKDSGAVFLYDPSINPDDSEYVQLFMKECEDLEEYERSSIRTEVVKEDNITTIVLSKSSYNRWKFRKAHNLDKIKAERPKVEKRTTIIGSVKRKRKRNKKSASEATSDQKLHCYCGLDLYARSTNRCEKCKWVFCPDGHCGCNYRGL